MRTPKIPPNAHTIRTYAHYHAMVDAFFAGHFALFLVLGNPGLSKSESFRRLLSANAHLINGWRTPLQAHIECFQNRNKLLVFDDAETLWSSPGGRVLMRSLCETTSVKTLRYGSTTRDLERAGVPKEFATSSSVAIIANSFSFGQASESAAILDRAHTIFFDPSAEEVHVNAATWFWDQSVFDYIGERLHQLRAHSGRLYVRGWQLKQAGGDWQGYVDQCLDNESPLWCVQQLEVDVECVTVAAKVAKFQAQTGMSRASFFNIRKRLKLDGQLEAPKNSTFSLLKVQGKAPVRPNIAEEVAKARREDLDRRESDSPGDDVLDPQGDSAVQQPTRHSEPPDNNPMAWIERQLTDALLRGDGQRAQKLRDLLQKMEDGGTGPRSPFL